MTRGKLPPCRLVTVVDERANEQDAYNQLMAALVRDDVVDLWNAATLAAKLQAQGVSLASGAEPGKVGRMHWRVGGLLEPP